MEWLNIESAPKDGSDFLGIDKNSCISICWWDDGVWSDAYTAFYDGIPANPSHWIPLPPPPKE